jgi:putative ABC transport system substrate-binding protein
MPSAINVAYLLSNSGKWDSSAGLSDRKAAQQLGIALTGNFFAEVNEVQLRRFAEISEQKFDAAIVDEGGTFLAQRALIVELAQKHRIPVSYPYRDYADSGGLMAYAPELGELAQRMANDVHQILNGAKPGDIPFYQPNKFQLIVNLKAAKALGLTIPQSLITSADEVIE